MANASTGGFKADREFYGTYLAPELDANSDLSVGQSPVVQRQWTDFSQGTLVPTNNPTDLALSGSGFFVVNGPTGPLYTRNGNFQMTNSGGLTTAEGYPVQLVGGRTLQASNNSPIIVQPDGTILQDNRFVGQIQVVDFADPGKLPRAGASYFENSGADTTAMKPSQASVLQGKVENSNSQPAEAAARMVLLLRHYEMLQKAIRVGTEMNQQSIQEVAKVGS
jgi:flagellar basal body rod protein FlgG